MALLKEQKSSLISDFRALNKSDQKTVLNELAGVGQSGLAEALDHSIAHRTLTPRQEACVGRRAPAVR